MKNFKQLLPEYNEHQHETQKPSKIKDILRSLFGSSVETPIESSGVKPTKRFGRRGTEDSNQTQSGRNVKFGRFDVASNVEDPSFFKDRPPPPTGSGSY
jgi:hypothetical protein